MDSRTMTGFEEDAVSSHQVQQKAIPKTQACLIEIYGNNVGQRYNIIKDVVSIGRGEENNIILEMDTVSRSHARINVMGNRYIIEDLISTNGTFVNDKAIDEQATLKDHDLIKIGGTIFRFLYGLNLEEDYRHQVYLSHIRDGLSGIYNNNYFRQHLQVEFARCRKYSRDVSLLFFEIDDFKGITNDYGRICADHTIRYLCQYLKKDLPIEETFCRIESNCFVIILPEQAMPKIKDFAEQLSERTTSTCIPFEDDEICITISIGLSTIEPTDKTYEDLISRAKQALQISHESSTAITFQ